MAGVATIACIGIGQHFRWCVDDRAAHAGARIVRRALGNELWRPIAHRKDGDVVHLRKRRSDSLAAGQAAVEFTLVSLALAMLIFGAIDLGRGVFEHQMLANAVREAARYGSVNRGDTAGMVASAANRSPSLGLSVSNFSSPDGIIECSYWQASGNVWVARPACNSTVQVGERLTVCATHRFGAVAPRLIGLSAIMMRDCAHTTIQ